MMELPPSPPSLLRIVIINVVISGTVGRVHVACECTGPSNAVATRHKISTDFMTCISLFGSCYVIDQGYDKLIYSEAMLTLLYVGYIPR